MRVAEMRAREDFDAVLTATLSNGWSQQIGTEMSVSASKGSQGLAFRYHRFLGAYYTSHLGSRGRQFLRDGIRFTPNRRRLMAQWLATELLGNQVGLKLLSQGGFWLSPPVKEAQQWVVIPGNQRVRVFDFSTMTTRVFLKEGFQARTMQQEIALRGSGKPGPFQPISAACPNGTFLEEPILDGWDLNRVPPWMNRKKLKKRARNLLLRWLERTQETVSRRDYVNDLVLRLNDSIKKVRIRYGDRLPQAESWIASLQERTEILPDQLITAQTHGDFQWGNVFVDRGGEDIVLIDWEHNKRRSLHYDFFTESLEARRFSLGNRTFVGRMRAYLEGKPLGAPIDALGGNKRLGLLAVCLLETLEFFLSEALSGPYKTPPESLLGVIEQWPLVDDELSRSERP